MSEELLNKIFEKLVSMDSKVNSIESKVNSMESDIVSMKSDIDNIKQTMATKEDVREIYNEIRNLKEADQAILDICEKTYHEVEGIKKEQKLHSAWLRKLTVDCAQNAVEIELLKEA